MTGRLPVLQQRRVLRLIPPCPPASPPPLHPNPGPLSPTGKVRWRLPAPSRTVMMGAVRLAQLLLPFKTEEAPKKEIDIMHPRFIFFFITQMICAHLVTATAHVVWLSSDRSRRVIRRIFPVCCRCIASKSHRGYHYYCSQFSAPFRKLQMLDNVWITTHAYAAVTSK